MRLLFVHGWGFDSTVWDSLAQSFPDRSFLERGYFGAAMEPEISGPFVAVTHSFGTMRFLCGPHPGCRGIVAINGFDRFCATGGFPGVPLRVIERMIERFRDRPAAVLAGFRERCGAVAHFGQLDRDRLGADLLALRDGDCREQSARCGLPILSLQGARDPVLPPAMRDAVFAEAGDCERLTHETGGHLLPLEDADTCVRAISAFMKRLT